MKTKSTCFSGLLLLFFWFQAAAQNKLLYVSDAGNYDAPPWQILKFDQDGQNGSVFISDHLAWPQDILFLENENSVLISNLTNGRISRFNATTGAFINEFATGIGGPTRLKIGPDGLLYVLQWSGNGRVRRYQLNGTYVGEFTTVGVPTGIGLDWDNDGNMYVASFNGKYVRKFSPAGADLGIFANTSLSGPTTIWFAGNGELVVMDWAAGNVKRYSSTGTYLGIFIAALPEGEGVAFLPDGNMLLGCGGTSSVRIYNSAGVFISNLIAPGTLGLLKPNAVVLREIPASSTHEIVKSENFLAPSAGAVFQLLSPENWRTPPSVEVYNALGIRVATPDFSNDPVWDAQHLPNGYYQLLAKTAEGSYLRQTIFIQK